MALGPGEQHGAMVVALATHDSLLRAAVERAGGTVVKTTGDGLLVAFERPGAAAQAHTPKTFMTSSP